MPILFILMNLIPSDTHILETEIFTINSKKMGFPDLRSMYWLILLKGVPLIVLTTWFFTCKYWWRLALSIPLIFAAAQFIKLFTAEKYFDDGEFWTAFILALPIMLLFVWIDRKIEGYRSSILLKIHIKSEMKDVINQISPINMNQELFEFYNRLEKIKKRKPLMNEEKYLLKIMTLKNHILVATRQTNNSKDH